MNAFEFAIARKVHQLKVQSAPLSKEDLSLLATCEWAVNGFETWRSLREADTAWRVKRANLRRANGVPQGRYRVVGETQDSQ